MSQNIFLNELVLFILKDALIKNFHLLKNNRYI